MTDPIRWYKDWRSGVLATSAFSRAPLPLSASNEWSLRNGRLSRSDGRFFSIVGIRSVVDGVPVTQPMIDEPEPSINACAVRRAGASPEWLLQFVVEPGNTHGAQLGPTLSATRANVQRVHDGRDPQFVDLVTGRRPLLGSGIWSAPGARFIGKRVECRSVFVEDDISLPDDDAYRWVAAPTVRRLLAEEYAIDEAARAVLATGPWDLLASTPEGPFTGRLRISYDAADRGIAYALDVLTQARRGRTPVETIPLEDVGGITLNPESATPLTHSSLEIHHVLVEAKTREVTRWDQPLVAMPGICQTALLLCPDADGTLRVRLQLDRSPGLVQSPEWTASVVAAPGSQRTLPDHEVLADVWCSDDGSRFDNCQHHVIVAMTDRPVPPPSPDAPFIDLTLGALERLVHTPGAVTSELRTAVSLLLSLA